MLITHHADKSYLPEMLITHHALTETLCTWLMMLTGYFRILNISLPM